MTAMGKGAQMCVLCWEVVPFSDDPLSDFPPYSLSHKVAWLKSIIDVHSAENLAFFIAESEFSSVFVVTDINISL